MEGELTGRSGWLLLPSLKLPKRAQEAGHKEEGGMLMHSRAQPPPIESLYIENLGKNIINLEQVQRGQLKCSGSQKDICKKKLQIRGSTKRD